MSNSGEPPEGPRGSSSYQPSEDEQSQGRRRHIRIGGMPEEEQQARKRRRNRLRDLSGENERRDKEENRDAKVVEPGASQGTLEQDVGAYEPRLTEAEAALGRKPWETTVIGTELGENLSRIEAKNREIAQQRYIVRYHEQHSPHQVPRQQTLLEELLREREEMPDTEENNMPEDQRDERERIDERLELLNWGLETCQCEAEEVNIQAAIRGYQSGAIPYSNNYTLIYAGHIVDSCPTYRSFCADRQERLHHYYARFGPGWLWHEPPLSGTGIEPLAKKGLCVPRSFSGRNYNIGSYFINMRFLADKSVVTRGNKPYNAATDEKLTWENFRTLLDSGSTFPILSSADFGRLDIDLRWHPAQGITRLSTLDSVQGYRFFELTVSVRDYDGETIVGEGDQAVWPSELKILGGLYPVCLRPGKGSSADRLSGMLPFEACYMSSAPTMMSLWVGEDRRDVLGASRMPAHMRYDPEKLIKVEIEDETLEKIRSEARTPDRVAFEHRLNSKKELSLLDTDQLGVRGRSQLMVIETEFRGPGRTPKVTPTRGVVVEPRQGAHLMAKPTEKAPISLWRREFLTSEELRSDGYTSIEDRPRKK
ncbi:hypothetical protein GGR52DRAFT_578828 [Hypoxylon sp. FL1284]|nr:hypothetical protein GGR52DRAFT_578828 [Hypoxylon sp. FL1284]